MTLGEKKSAVHHHLPVHHHHHPVALAGYLLTYKVARFEKILMDNNFLSLVLESLIPRNRDVPV